MTDVRIVGAPDTGYQVAVDDEHAGPYYSTLDDALAYVRDVLADTNLTGDNPMADVPTRTATITYRDAVAAAADLVRVRAYLPRGYTAGTSDERIIITGRDNAGWTLDGYVIPRLASGLIFAEEVAGMTRRMFALVTRQGTAASESALCERHHADSGIRDQARVLANAGGDIDVTRAFVDCTGNDELQCIACNAEEVTA